MPPTPGGISFSQAGL